MSFWNCEVCGTDVRAMNHMSICVQAQARARQLHATSCSDSEPLVTKTVAIKLTSDIPLKVMDDQGRVIGSAHLDGSVGLTIVVDKHHPASFDLDTGNGLAKLKLTAHVEDNIVDGALTIAGG